MFVMMVVMVMIVLMVVVMVMVVMMFMVMVVMMFMVVVMVMLTMVVIIMDFLHYWMSVCIIAFNRYYNVNLICTDSVLYGSAENHVIAFNIELIKLGNKFILIYSQIEQCTERHISADTGTAIEVKCFHFEAPSLFMLFAVYPAPKPLSILTTTTPLAQLLSIQRREERPLKFAP